jgi:toxin ParE1/3/4
VNYFFNDAARIEHLDQVAYYEARQVGLGARYLAAFDVAMEKVCHAPNRYRIEFPPNIRRHVVPGFPFNILYRHVDQEVEVLVVAPHRRSPSYWIGRL